MSVVEFEWNRTKAEKNRKNHSVDFTEASTVFSNPLELTISGPVHSTYEFQFLSIARSNIGNLLAVSYIEREEKRIKIIRARRATKLEKPIIAAKAGGLKLMMKH
jgi:uncharacterized DUF497 family protein